MPKAPKPLKASELQYQIYALIDPRDKCIRYVGLSVDVNYRYFQHLHPDTRHQGKQEMAWVKELQRLGLSPILQVLETVDDNTYLAACKREHYWIQKLQASGQSLLNVRGVTRPYPQTKINRKVHDDQQGKSALYANPVPSIIEIVKPHILAISSRKHLIPTENMYEFTKLLENMPASLSELSRIADVHERSIMRMRDGYRVQRSTANKVLRGLSQLYGQTYTLDNVTGINIQ